MRKNGSAPAVLVVAGSREIRSEIRRRLEADGYRVLGAPDSKGAARRARHEHPGLILMDVNAPGREVMAAARHIREQARAPGTPIVVVEVAGLRRAVVNSGRNEYVAKLRNFRQVEELVTGLLPAAGTG